MYDTMHLYKYSTTFKQNPFLPVSCQNSDVLRES